MSTNMKSQAKLEGTAPTAAGGNGALLRVDLIFKIFSFNMKESFQYDKI